MFKTTFTGGTKFMEITVDFNTARLLAKHVLDTTTPGADPDVIVRWVADTINDTLKSEALNE